MPTVTLKKKKLTQKLVRRDNGHSTSLYVNFYVNVEIGEEKFKKYLVEDLRQLADAVEQGKWPWI